MQYLMPLKLELINEGDVLKEIDKLIEKKSIELTEHRKKYPTAPAKGQEFEINLKLKVKLMDSKELHYELSTAISSKGPNPPGRTSLATEELSKTLSGTNLYVGVGGSDHDSPLQLRLFKDDPNLITKKDDKKKDKEEKKKA